MKARPMICKDIELFIFNHNGAGYVQKCLTAAKAQTLQPRQTYFIDNGSTDNSLEIAKTFKNVMIISNPKNYGIGYVQNQAMGLCETKYAAFLHVDAFPTPNWLKILYKTAEKEQAAAVEGEIIHPDGQVLHGETIRWFKEILLDKPKRYPNSISTCATLFRTGLLPRYFPNYKYSGEDVWMSQQLLRLGHKLVHECSAKVQHVGTYTMKNWKTKLFYKYLEYFHRFQNILEFGIKPYKNPYAK